MSAERAAAFTNSHLLLDPNYSQVSTSFAMDVIDIGSFAKPLRMAPGLGCSGLYRLNGKARRREPLGTMIGSAMTQVDNTEAILRTITSIRLTERQP
ncbi:hypothetical protein ACX80N_12510 [Arthrobacter sp. MDT2-16]